MRNDEFDRAERRWSKRRDIFAERRRRHFPWKGVLIVLGLALALLALGRSDLGGLLDTVSSLLPEASPGSQPAQDPNSLPLLPLPPPGGH